MAKSRTKSTNARRPGTKSSSNASSKRSSSNSNSENTNTNTNTQTTGVMDMALSSIQPLRDLSRNWDVDVASCLEEYLQELAGIHPQQLKNLAARESTADGNSRNLVTRESNEGKNNNNNRKKNECYEVPNFAHAALILQNSSNVYSRKVDYLFTLVFKALDEFFDASKIASLTSSSSAASKRRGNKPAVDSDVDDFFQYDPQEWFLLLDDVVPEDLTQKKINMKEEKDEEEENKGPSIFGRRDRTSGASTNTSTNKNDVTHLSLGATLAGLNVTKLDRTSSGGTYGTSSSSGSKSSVQQQRALLGILNNGSLRLMAGQCDVGEDGILLMPGSQSSSNSNSKGNNSTIDGTVTNDSLMTNRDSLGDGNNTEKNDNINMNNNNNNEQLPPQAGTDIDIDGGPKNLFGDTVHNDNDDMNVNTNNHDDDDNDHYDNDDEGPGFVMNDNDDNNNDNNDNNVNDNGDGGISSGLMAMDIEENVATVGSTLASSTKRVAFAESTEEQELERRRKQQQQQQEEQKKKERVDPWALLDPHSMGDSSYTLKPLKKGKTYRLPKGITRPPSECVTGSSTIHHPTPPPQETSMNQSILILKHKTRRMKRATITQPPTINRTGKGLFQLRPSLAVETFRVAMGKQLPESIDLQNKINFRGLAYGEEFLYIAKQNAKLRAAKRREEKKQQQGTTTGTTTTPSYDEQQQQLNSGENNNDDYDDGDDDDNGAGFDFGGGGGDHDYDDDDDNDNNDNNANTGNAGMSSLDEAFQRNRNNGSGDGTGTGDGDGSSAAGGEAGQTFEELCRAHIQAFAKSAEKFALTTKLSDRISQWQKYLQPILDEEEQKTTFDIHRYGQMLLETAMKARAEAAAETAAAASRAMEEDDDDETQKKRSSEQEHDLLDFEVVTRGCTRSDICRMFLASLTLANAGNIKIEEGMDGYKFDIITDKVENPMETYQAPSTQEDDDDD